MDNELRLEHASTQGRYFNEKAHNFVRPIPESIQERTRAIVGAAKLSKDSAVLDVGTGCGVLIGHFLEFGVKQNNIVGCDLSEAMLQNARSKYPDVFYYRGDVMDFSLHNPPAGFPETIKAFDAVFYNACFGNLFDQRKVLTHTKQLLFDNGKIIISHPLGAKFVAQLRANEPEIVPHLLPDENICATWASELGLQLEHFESSENYYLAILKI